MGRVNFGSSVSAEATGQRPVRAPSREHESRALPIPLKTVYGRTPLRADTCCSVLRAMYYTIGLDGVATVSMITCNNHNLDWRRTNTRMAHGTHCHVRSAGLLRDLTIPMVQCVGIATAVGNNKQAKESGRRRRVATVSRQIQRTLVARMVTTTCDSHMWPSLAVRLCQDSAVSDRLARLGGVRDIWTHNSLVVTGHLQVCFLEQ